MRAACAFVAVLVVAELVGWHVYRSVHHGPTALELTEKCLRREKLLPIESLTGDPIARTARGGTLATRVEGNGVQVVIATSDDEAARLEAAYLRTGRKIRLRLDVRGHVLYVWEMPRSAVADTAPDDVRLLVRVTALRAGDVAGTRLRDERRAARLGLMGALVVVLAQLSVGAAWSLTARRPHELELTRRCLERDRGLTVEPTAGDPVAASARGGTLPHGRRGWPRHASASLRAQAEVERLRAAYAARGDPGPAARRARTLRRPLAARAVPDAAPGDL